jgi:hypothetical protein
LAEKFAICWVGVFFAPVSPTDAHPSTAFTACPNASSSSSSPTSAPAALRLPLLPGGLALPHRRWMNKWSHLLALALEWRSARDAVNAWREARLKLPPIPNALGVLPLIKRQTLPVVHPLHPAFFAKPHDWAAELKVPAFLFLPDKPAPAPFLSSDLRLELAADKDNTTPSSSGARVRCEVRAVCACAACWGSLLTGGTGVQLWSRRRGRRRKTRARRRRSSGWSGS